MSNVAYLNAAAERPRHVHALSEERRFHESDA